MVPTDIVFMTSYPAPKRVRFLQAYLVEQAGKLEPAEVRTNATDCVPALRYTLASAVPGVHRRRRRSPRG